MLDEDSVLFAVFVVGIIKFETLKGDYCCFWEESRLRILVEKNSSMIPFDCDCLLDLVNESGPLLPLTLLFKLVLNLPGVT
jgi:hypothetical protein